MSDDENDHDEQNITREKNHVYFYSDVDAESVFRLNKLLREAEEFCFITAFQLNIPEIPIYLHINSCGGSLMDAFATIDLIGCCRVPVHSIVEGSVASAGTLMSVVCNKRYIAPNSYMLIHQLSSEAGGKMMEIVDEMENLTKLMKRLKKIYREHTSLKKKELNDLLKRDLLLDAETSLKHGLVDELWSGRVV